MMKIISLSATSLLALAANAAEYQLKSGATDYADVESYLVDGVKPDALPGPEDIVLLPADGTVEVSAPSTAFSSLAAAGRIVPSYSKLVIDVSDGETCEMSAAFAYGSGNVDYTRGELVKRGGGCLNLNGGASPDLSSAYSYFCNIAVEGGVLRTPDGSVSTRYHGHLSVSNGAALHLPPNATTSCRCAGLFGEGLVTNLSETVLPLEIRCQWTSAHDGVDFSGAIGGAIELTSNGVGSLTGTNSTFRSFVSNHRMQTSNGGIASSRYVLGIAKVGKAGEPSSIGTNGTIYTDYYGGCLKYLGNGERTDKSLRLRMLGLASAVPSTIDGGSCGGLVIEGDSVSLAYANSSFGIHRLELTGDNTNACVLASPVTLTTNNGKTYPIHVKKSGTGRWELRDAASRSTNSGAFTIEEGELGYEMLAEAGEPCAFGTSTNLYEYISAVGIPTDKSIPYAFILGSGIKTGTLDYIGTNRVATTTRPFGLAGTGRFTVTGDDRAEVFLSGISAIGNGEKRKLVLDGDVGTNTFANVTNGEGVVSVTKKGLGTWVLAGDTSFSGTLSVEAGRLVVRAPDAPYTWHRLTVKSVWGTVFPRVQEFAMYDATGTRCNNGLAFLHTITSLTSGFRITPTERVLELLPGHATHSDGSAHKVTYTSREFNSMFDDDGSTHWRLESLGGSAAPSENKPSNWLSITMRQPADAGEIVAYDFAAQGATATYGIKKYMIEGSQDGAIWMTLTNATFGVYNEDTGEYDAPTVASGQWYSTGGTFAAKRTLGEDEGFRIPGRPEWNGPAPLSGIEYADVSSGAILEAEGAVSLRAIRVDCEGAGTIKGFTLPAAGNLVIANAPQASGAFVLPMTFENVTGIANLAGWNLSFEGGAAIKGRHVVVSGNEVKLVAVGFRIIFK